MSEVVTYHMPPEEIERRYGTWGDKEIAAKLKTRYKAGAPDAERGYRRKKITDAQLLAEIDAGSTVSEIAEAYGISVRWVREQMKGVRE